VTEETFTAALQTGKCPDCGGEDFRPGPRAGISQNVECRRCRSRFNVTRHQETVLFVQRIEREDEGGAEWPAVIFTAGQSVEITCEGRTVEGTMRVTSDNGISLIVEFEALLAGHAGLMALMWAGAGEYRSLINGVAVSVAPA